jgi:hypothetical protein
MARGGKFARDAVGLRSAYALKKVMTMVVGSLLAVDREHANSNLWKGQRLQERRRSWLIGHGGERECGRWTDTPADKQCGREVQGATEPKLARFSRGRPVGVLVQKHWRWARRSLRSTDTSRVDGSRTAHRSTIGGRR